MWHFLSLLFSCAGYQRGSNSSEKASPPPQIYCFSISFLLILSSVRTTIFATFPGHSCPKTSSVRPLDSHRHSAHAEAKIECSGIPIRLRHKETFQTLVSSFLPGLYKSEYRSAAIPALTAGPLSFLIRKDPSASPPLPVVTRHSFLCVKLSRSSSSTVPA